MASAFKVNETVGFRYQKAYNKIDHYTTKFVVYKTVFEAWHTYLHSFNFQSKRKKNEYFGFKSQAFFNTNLFAILKFKSI